MSEQDVYEFIQQGEQCRIRGDFLSAVASFEAAAALARTLNNSTAELHALSCLAVTWGNIADPQRGLEASTRLLAKAHELHDEAFSMQGGLRMVEAIAKIDLRGRWLELRPLLEEGLQIARRLGDRWFETYHLMRLGEYLTRLGEVEQGFAWIQEEINTIASDIDEKSQHYFRAEAYRVLSFAMRKRENYEEAVRYAEMAVGEFQTYGKPAFKAYAQLELTRSDRARGHRGEALRLAEEVYRQSKQNGWKLGEQEAAYLRGELEREIGHPEVAEEFTRHALQLARELKMKEEEVEALLSLGKALKALGRKKEARSTWQEARELSREREYEDHYEGAEELLETLDNGDVDA